MDIRKKDNDTSILLSPEQTSAIVSMRPYLKDSIQGRIHERANFNLSGSQRHAGHAAYFVARVHKHELPALLKLISVRIEEADIRKRELEDLYRVLGVHYGEVGGLAGELL